MNHIYKLITVLVLSSTINVYSQLGVGTSSPTVELDVESANAVTAIDINATNAGDGDPQINFQLESTTTFSIGVDDTDDFFKIGTTAPGTSTMMTVNSSGQLGIGTEAPAEFIHVEGSDADIRLNAITDSDSPALVLRRARSGTALVQDDNSCGHIYFMGYDGNSYETFARIEAEVDGTAADGDTPGRLVFYTVPSGSTTDVERMCIENDGDVRIGNVGGDWGYRLEVVDDDDDAISSTLRILNLSSSPASGDRLRIEGQMRDAGSSLTDVFNINAIFDDATDGSEDSHLEFAINNNGTLTSYAQLESIGDWSPVTDNTVGLGNTTYKWTDVWATNGTVQTSDIRFKEDIQELEYGLEEVLALRTISYKWKHEKFLEKYNQQVEQQKKLYSESVKNDDDKLPSFAPPVKDESIHIGLIAQQLQEVLPEVVIASENEEDALGVKYSDIIPVLVKAIQEQQAQIEALKYDLEVVAKSNDKSKIEEKASK